MGRRSEHNDERYVIDICDRILGRVAKRQHRFEFLTGDPGRSGRRTRLPVDAYYSELHLVIEYREIQHFRDIPFMDKRMTCSGMPRGLQRRRYDELRRAVLLQHNIVLVELNYQDFAHVGGRLKRTQVEDDATLSDRLSAFLTDQSQPGNSTRQVQESVSCQQD
jgi:hypothetical protein